MKSNSCTSFKSMPFSGDALRHVFREKNNSGADFTLRSKKTGKDFTYRIKRVKYQNKWYTHVYVETGYMQFKRLGHYFRGQLWNKHQAVDSKSAQAISWCLSRVEQNQIELLDNNVECMHTGSCIVCGRTLTDAVSISMGIGPVCRSK